RFMQITSGFMVTEHERPDGTIEEREQPVDDGKRRLLKEIIEDLPPDEPVAVFCLFSNDVQAVHDVAESLGRKSSELSGRVNDIGAVWKHGEDTVAAVQIQSGGVGIDLTRACTAVLDSIGFNLVNYQRAKARCH